MKIQNSETFQPKRSNFKVLVAGFLLGLGAATIFTELNSKKKTQGTKVQRQLQIELQSEITKVLKRISPKDLKIQYISYKFQNSSQRNLTSNLDFSAISNPSAELFVEIQLIEASEIQKVVFQLSFFEGTTNKKIEEVSMSFSTRTEKEKPDQKTDRAK